MEELRNAWNEQITIYGKSYFSIIWSRIFIESQQNILFIVLFHRIWIYYIISKFFLGWKELIGIKDYTKSLERYICTNIQTSFRSGCWLSSIVLKTEIVFNILIKKSLSKKSEFFTHLFVSNNYRTYDKLILSLLFLWTDLLSCFWGNSF